MGGRRRYYSFSAIYVKAEMAQLAARSSGPVSPDLVAQRSDVYYMLH